MTSKKTKLLVTAAFFIALDIIAARFLSIEIPVGAGTMKFDFQILVACLCGFILGPFWACLSLVASDLLGVMLNSGTLGVFFGFTLSAALRGLILGFLLHNKSIKWLNMSIAVITSYSFIDILLNTFWLHILTKTPFLTLLSIRIIPKSIFMIVQLIIILSSYKLFEYSKKQFHP